MRWQSDCWRLERTSTPVPQRMATPIGRRCTTPPGEITALRCHGSLNTEPTKQGSTSSAAHPWKQPSISITRKSSSCYLRNEAGQAPIHRPAVDETERRLVAKHFLTQDGSSWLRKFHHSVLLRRGWVALGGSAAGRSFWDSARNFLMTLLTRLSHM